MKVAIITFSDMNTNYGSILQSYALKTYIESCGHNVTFIRYREFHPIVCRSIKLRIRSLMVRAYYLVFSYSIKKRKRAFDRFIANNLSHTRLFVSEEDLEQHLQQYDAYVCGSDQIWNIPILGGFRAPYFLKFAPADKVKIAYAPSIGEYKVDDQYKFAFIEGLKNLSYISVREKRSIEILSSLTDKTISWVMDPVFLLSKDSWSSKSECHISSPHGEYGLCYFVRRSKLAEELVKKLRKKYKIPIYNVSDNLISVSGTNNKYRCSSPADFILLVKNAKFCVGTSFHLAAFSIIFNRPCYIAGTAHNKERLLNILKLVDREKCLILNADEIDKSINVMQLNGNEKQLEDLISNSKQFINISLSNGCS